MKKRILSTFLTFALLLTLLPTAVMAEGNTIYTDMNYKGVGNGSYSQPYASFETALEKARDGDTIAIKGKSFINVQTVEDAPFVIDKAVTITGANNSTGELYIRASGILLGADVTMQNVELNLANKYHNAIFVDGHSFTAENVTRGSGSRAVHLFAGGLTTTNTIQIPAPGSAAALTLTNSTFGNIHGGGMNGTYTGNAQINITNSTVGAIYGSGAKEAEFNRNNWFDTTEPPVPTADPNQYTVDGPVNITVDGASTASGTYTVSVDGNGSGGTSLTINNASASKKLNLAGLSSLTVNGGTAAIAEINSDAAVTLENSAAIDFSGSETKTVSSLSGGGKIILGKEDKLTISGAFDGTYTFETSGGFNEASGLAKYDHTYITAGTNNATVSFKPYNSQGDMDLQKSGNTWKTTPVPSSPSYVEGFTIKQNKIEHSFNKINGTAGTAEGTSVDVEWTSSGSNAYLEDVPLRFEVTLIGGAIYKVQSSVTKDDATDRNVAKIPELSMEIEMTTTQPALGEGAITVQKDSTATGNVPAGAYFFSVFAPDANGGEIQQSFTLIVTEESPSTTETTTTIEKSGLQNVTFGDDLTLTATVTANNTSVSDPAVEYYINGKRIDSNPVSVTPGNSFKLGSNELRAIYPGDTAYAVSVGIASVTVSKATDASIHGFQVPAGGTFDGTVHTGSQTNLTVQRNGVTLDSSPSVMVEYTLNGQAVSQPVFPGDYTVTLSAPEGETYTEIQQNEGSFTIGKAAPTVTAAAEDKGSGTVELTATVSGVGAYFPTGSVTLKLGTQEFLVNLNNGAASQTIKNVAAGTHRYSASYTPADDDALYERASSSEQSVTVSDGSTPVTPELKTLEISGVDTVTVPGTAEYAVTGKDQGGNNFDLNSVSLTWSIDGVPAGVSINGGKLSVTDVAIAGSITIRVTVGSVFATKAVRLTVSDKPASKTDVTDKIDFPDGELTYNGKGQTYEKASITGVSGGRLTYYYVPTDVSATLDGGLPKTAGTYTVTAKYEDDTSFGTKTATLSIKKATVTVTAKNQSIYVGGTVPSLISPVEGTHYTVTGLAEGDKLNGKITLNYMNGTSTAPVEPDNTKAGTYHIVITGISVPDNNYEPIKTTNGTLTIQARPSGGSSSGGSSSSGGGSSSGSSSSSGKVETTTKPDGTKIQTETKKDGTKVETTTAKDGSTSKTTTNPNGSSVTENKAADGSTGTVKTDKHGQTTAETQLSGKAIEDAKKNGEPVKAPVEVEATRNSNTAPVVNIEVPKSAGETKVEIPVSNVKPGTVAVLVHPDGTEEIIKNSVPTEDGIQLTVNGGATVKIVDNSKDFIDTREHWSRDQVNFVAARELFQGVGDNQFGVGRPMTRGMVNTVLARLAGVDTTPAAGQNWYDKGITWARENGVSDGTNPNGSVTREQLATMLYRYAGSPAVNGSLPFSDADTASDYAQNALLWATQNGILNGYGDGRVGPKANAERAQVAAMMARFIQNAQ